MGIARAVFLAFAGALAAGAAHGDTPVRNEFRVTVSSSQETTPTLGNDGTSDLVVYTMRAVLPDGTLAPGDIWYQRLAAGTQIGPAFQVTAGPFDDQLNDVSGDYIVYTSYDSIDSTSGVIMLYRISTYQLAPLARAEVAREPRIFGNNVVWGEGPAGASRIMWYELGWLGTPTEAWALAGPYPPAHEVAIGSRYIVWAELASGQWDIWGFDLQYPGRFQVTSTPGIDESQPATSGDWITWQTWRQGSTSIEIEAWNRDAYDLRLVALNGAYNMRPSIDGDFIAWESTVTGNHDVFLYRLSTAETFQVTTDPAHQYLSDVFGNRVAWVDTRNPNPQPAASEDIYVSDLSFATVSPACYDFGTVVAFTVASTCVNVTSMGADLRILPSLSPGSTPPFSIDLVADPAGYPIRSGETFCVPVVFAPTQVTQDPTSPPSTVLTIAAGTPSATLAAVPLAGTAIPGYGDIQVAPNSLFFGDVEVGSSKALIVTVTNSSPHWPSPVVADLLSGSSPAFSFGCVAPTSCSCASGACSFVVAPDTTADLEVLFVPASLGSASATLSVSATDQSNQAATVNLSGSGVHVPTPSELVADLLAFFDATAADGSLTGNGPGNSAAGRLHALRNMIEAAGDLVAKGQYARACQQLLDAYLRVDGMSPPPDFATGPAASELRARISALRASIGCS